jgi:hypothetical protein
MPVIAPGQGGISAFVTLADGELLSEEFNSVKVVVFRRGESTNRQMKIVKPFGKLATPDLLRPALPPICTYLERMEGGDPLHEHADGTWWFYEQNFQMENGPYESWDEAHACLVTYCELLQEYLENPNLTTEVKDEKITLEKLVSDIDSSVD